MHWRNKARIMKFMAFLRSENAYMLLQRAFGRLTADPMARIPTHVEMMQWLVENGQSPEGRVVFEVGTGNLPVIPVGFFLCGAAWCWVTQFPSCKGLPPIAPSLIL